MLIYYVYAYISERTGLPYYIGKGKGCRAFKLHDKIPVPTDRSRIIFFERNLTELGAFALERRYIRWYGRRDTIYENGQPGYLLNRTDGGDGSSGKIYSEESKSKMRAAKEYITDETRQKLSEALKGRKQSAEFIEKRIKPLRGKTRILSDEARRKMSEANKGKTRTISEEMRQKWRDGQQRRRSRSNTSQD